MWTLRSAAHYVAPAFICLFSMFIAGGAHAQTATDASDSKRVQVLQVQEVSATNESSVKKSKTAATLAKKKVAQRRTTRQTKAAANEGANTPLQSAMAVVVPATPAQNDTLALSAEQTGTLAVGDRAVALASSPGEDNNVGLSLANYVGTRKTHQVPLPSENRRARFPTPSKPPALRWPDRRCRQARTPLCHKRWRR